MSATKTDNPVVPLQHVPPQVVNEWLTSGEAVLVDIREPFEYAAESIEGSTHQPQSGIDLERLNEEYGEHRVVFACRTGRRSEEVARQYYLLCGEALHLAGGVEAWKGDGLPTQRSEGAPKLDVMRQVQMVAGALILSGTALGAFVHPGFLALSGFVGAGLMFAGISGWCGMAKLLARMPWNRAGCC